ncbi:MAG: dihydroneopterin aldolase [Candidatus Omnitrophota bacterium]
MDGKIFVHGLEVSCIIGTLSRERKKKQPLVIDLEFPAPVKRAARRDDLRDALNYQKIAERATAFVSKSRFYLLETLAERLAQALLLEFELKDIALRISKPNAIRNAKNAGVAVFRRKNGSS